jgi:hypothetical protein
MLKIEQELFDMHAMITFNYYNVAIDHLRKARQATKKDLPYNYPNQQSIQYI